MVIRQIILVLMTVSLWGAVNTFFYNKGFGNVVMVKLRAVLNLL